MSRRCHCGAAAINFVMSTYLQTTFTNTTMSLSGDYECSSRTKMKLALLVVFLQLTMSGYGYNIGTDVTLDYHHELSSQASSYFCLASIEHTSEPFFYQTEINPGGLRPGQAGRVYVLVEESGRNLIIYIIIQDLQRIDEGYYIVNVEEYIDGTLTPHLYESYVHVTYPPGQVECQIINPPLPTENWLVVSCNATLGSDDSGYILCFQNSQQALYLQPARHVGHNVTAYFWIDPTRQIQCCSSDASDTDLDSCDDFVYTPPLDSLTSYRPDHYAPTVWIPSSPSPTDDGSPPNQGHTSQRDIVIFVIIAVTPYILLIA